MAYSKGHLDPCTPRRGSATTWCLYYDTKQPEERGKCPHTCYYAQEQAKKKMRSKLEEEVIEDDFLM